MLEGKGCLRVVLSHVKKENSDVGRKGLLETGAISKTPSIPKGVPFTGPAPIPYLL